MNALPRRPQTFTQEKVVDGASNAAAISATTTLPCCTMDADFVVDKFEVEVVGGYTSDASAYYDISLQIAPATCTATAATDTLNATGHNLQTGDSVQFTNSGGGLPAGLTAGTTYYVVLVDADHFKVADTLAHAQAGTNIVDITTAGTGTQKFAKLLAMYSLVTVTGNGDLTTLVFASGTLQNNPTGPSGAQLNVVLTKFSTAANVGANSVFNFHAHLL
jgi:hypothetical protein